MAPNPSQSLVAAFGLGGLEWFLILALVLVLGGSVWGGRSRKSGDPSGNPRQSLQPADWQETLVLWLAEGFGAGRIPVAPGTFGSVIGLVWTLALVSTQNAWGFGLGLLAGLAISVGLCGVAERRLGARDPGSVVLDEIAALPLCFAGWIVYRLWVAGQMPSPDTLVSGRGWLLLLAGFAAFRLFDIAKPWPVRQSQALPGGWGVTVDDVLAALYANVVWIPFAGLGWL